MNSLEKFKELYPNKKISNEDLIDDWCPCHFNIKNEYASKFDDDCLGTNCEDCIKCWNSTVIE